MRPAIWHDSHLNLIPFAVAHCLGITPTQTHKPVYYWTPVCTNNFQAIHRRIFLIIQLSGGKENKVPRSEKYFVIQKSYTEKCSFL